jgi:hypothetical protein
MLNKLFTIDKCIKVLWIGDGSVIIQRKINLKYELYILNGRGSRHVTLESRSSGVFRFRNHGWFLTQGINPSLILDQNFNIIDKLKLNGNAVIQSIGEAKYFIVSNRSSEIPTKTVHDCNNLSQLWSTSNNVVLLNNQIFEYKVRDEFKIGKVHLESKTLSWEIDLNEIEYKGNYPKIFKSNVLCFMHDNYSKINDTVAIDVSNGNLLWKREVPNKRYYKADNRNDKLISLFDGYIERDLFTGKITFENVDKDVFKDFNPQYRGSNFIQVGKFLIAIVHNRNKIFIYNTESHQFDFVYTDPEVINFATASELVFYNDNLFIKDINNVMHVYKFDNVDEL